MLRSFLISGLLLGTVAVAVPVPVQAASWVASNDKGLRIYELGNTTTGKLTLVCDPENFWSAPEQGLKPQYFLMLKYKDADLMANGVTITADTYSKALPFNAGTLFADDKEQWNELIKALQKPGLITVSTSQESFSITNDKPLKSQCIKSQ